MTNQDMTDDEVEFAISKAKLEITQLNIEIAERGELLKAKEAELNRLILTGAFFVAEIPFNSGCYSGRDSYKRTYKDPLAEGVQPLLHTRPGCGERAGG